MTTQTFRFKQFSVEQSAGAGMKVGTDGVLLGAWCRLGEAQRRLLDVGTGTGVIALMLAQRAPWAGVDALDIDPTCCAQAAANAARSPWAGRVRIVESSVQDYAARAAHRYDHIVSNPPYFTESLLPPSAARTTARHTATLPHTELVDAVAALLAPEGLFSVILPVEEALSMRTYAASRGLYVRRTTAMAAREGAPPKRLLIEYGFSPAADPAEERIDIMERDGGAYTEAYRVLTGAFYLKC